MKNPILFCFLGALVMFSFYSFQEPKLKKRITDKEFKYEFYVTDKEPSIKEERIYYWFKGGSIHNAENGIAGELLDDSYSKFYLNNQLAESGSFESGLKVGLWKTWYPNGVLESSQYWADGRRRGMYYHYDTSAELLEKGRYAKNKKQGVWINYSLKDTVTYAKGERIVKSEKELAKEAKRKADKAKRKQKREAKQNIKKAERAAKKIAKQNKDAEDKAAAVKNGTKKEEVSKTQKSTLQPEVKTTKDNFFKRLFSKKKKANDKSQ